MSFTSLLKSVQAVDEDFEWYPTSTRIIEVVSRRLDKTKPDTSILDIGAGDGRVLRQLAEGFTGPYTCTPTLYAIEKSLTLIEAQPENVIPVGTDLFEQNLACLPVTYIYCNPPYSQFESWAVMIIESGHARKAFMVLPQRWKDNPSIKVALEKRGASAKVIHNDDFYDAPRRARAVVDVVEVSYPMKDDHHWNEVKDPFDVWFDQNISTFDSEEDTSRQTDYDLESRELTRVRQLDSISAMVEAYQEEYTRMEANYKAIFQLDYALLKELGVNKENVRDGIKVKMAGLKARYWTVLFERLDAITNRLSTATKAKFTERLTGRVTLAFTENNAYAVVLWAIKNANKYFDEQTVALYRDLSTYEGVLNYKSNVRTWQVNDWRYYKHSDEFKPSHYALDYRIVLEKYHGIFSSDFGMYEYPGNLHKTCHEVIADVIAVLFNLGFVAHGEKSMDRQWTAGQWQDWYKGGDFETSPVLFQVKAHKNGNLHFRFMPDAIKALNVEAGRLLGWLKGPSDVVKELGYTAEEAERLYATMKMIVPGSDGVRLMLTGREEVEDESV